jgi:hypothetical protein
VFALHDQAIRTFPHYCNVLILLHFCLSLSRGLTATLTFLRSVKMLQSKQYLLLFYVTCSVHSPWLK